MDERAKSKQKQSHFELLQLKRKEEPCNLTTWSCNLERLQWIIHQTRKVDPLLNTHLVILHCWLLYAQEKWVKLALQAASNGAAHAARTSIAVF